MILRTSSQLYKRTRVDRVQMKCRHGNNGAQAFKRHRASVHPTRSWMHSSLRAEDLLYLSSRFPLLPSYSGLRTYGFRNGIPFHFVILFRPHNPEHPPSILAITNVELDKDTLPIGTAALGYVSNFSCKMIQVRLVDVQFPLLFPSKIHNPSSLPEPPSCPRLNRFDFYISFRRLKRLD
jgi:hypothetical protein